MNTSTNHIVDPLTFRGTMDGYEPVPQNLTRAGRRVLAGKAEATVSKNSGGKLSKWAARQRKKKNQMAKAARRANRHI